MMPDLLAKGSACRSEGEGGDSGALVGEVKVEPIGSGGQDGVVVGEDLVPLGCVGVVFLVFYPETGEGSGGGGYCEETDG